MNRRYGVTKTGRAIDILVLALFIPGVLNALGFQTGILILDAIGGYLVLTAATVALAVIGGRAWGAPRYLTWLAAVAGGAASLAALNNVAASTSDSGKLHMLAIGIWVLGGIIGLANFHPRDRESESVHDVADRTRAGRKGSKALIVLLVIGIVMALVIGGFNALRAAASEPAKQFARDLQTTQAQVGDLGGDDLLSEAKAIDETIETECFGPRIDNGLALTETAEQADAVAFDAASARCQGIGVENASFPDRVTDITDGILDVADSLGLTHVLGLVRDNVSDETVQDVQNGDIEKAITDLYTGVENGEVQ